MCRGGLTVALVFCATISSAQAADHVVIADVVELSGGGASNGVNWRDGLSLATDEINAAGGLLARQIALRHYDTQTNPTMSRAMVQKALDERPYVVMGPIYSGSVKANMALAEADKVPQLVGAQAAELTELGNDYLFRANISQKIGMAKIARYMSRALSAKKIAVVWVNNDFGKGGRNVLAEELKQVGIQIVADLPIEFGQVDFAVDVLKAKASGADVVFPYMTAEETARFVKEYRKQDGMAPLVGETTLLQQNVIDIAGPALDGARSHLSLTADAPNEHIRAFREKFERRFGRVPDHNAISSYSALYAVRVATNKSGKIDPAALAQTFHGLKITEQTEPNILLDSTWDNKGDLHRASFLGELAGGKLRIIATLE
jgi:branched-chain amino acid transport system substrate-binding protein